MVRWISVSIVPSLVRRSWSRSAWFVIWRIPPIIIRWYGHTSSSVRWIFSISHSIHLQCCNLQREYVIKMAPWNCNFANYGNLNENGESNFRSMFVWTRNFVLKLIIQSKLRILLTFVKNYLWSFLEKMPCAHFIFMRKCIFKARKCSYSEKFNG